MFKFYRSYFQFFLYESDVAVITVLRYCVACDCYHVMYCMSHKAPLYFAHNSVGHQPVLMTKQKLKVKF